MMQRVQSLTTDDHTPVNVLIEDIFSEELPRRVNAVKHIKQIALAIGN